MIITINIPKDIEPRVLAAVQERYGSADPEVLQAAVLNFVQGIVVSYEANEASRIAEKSARDKAKQEIVLGGKVDSSGTQLEEVIR